jgi:membrane protein
MTAGIIWCLYLSLLTFYKNIILKKTPLSLEKPFLLGAALASGFCWLQAILNTLNIPGDQILLCLGCTNLSFGFPHPNGFAIEPQFMGNLLLAPAIFLVFRMIHPKSRQTHQTKIFYLALAGYIISTLFLIFSRGATYSFFLAVAVIFLYEIFHAKKKLLVASKIVSLILFPLIFVTLIQGLMSEFGPTSDTFLGGVSRSLSQMTLGRIKIPLPEAKNPSATSNESSSLAPNDNVSTNSNTNSSANSTSTTPLFDGYIAESTDIRVKLSKMGLRLALSHPRQFLFGSGLGSSGIALYRAFPELGSTKEITQNEYVAILVEAGFIGILIIFCSGTCVFYLCYSRQKSVKPSSSQSSKQSMKKSNFTNLISSITPAKLYFASLILAYAASVCFFSGLPNALHIYLVPILYPALFAKNFEFL